MHYDGIQHHALRSLPTCLAEETSVMLAQTRQKCKIAESSGDGYLYYGRFDLLLKIERPNKPGRPELRQRLSPPAKPMAELGCLDEKPRKGPISMVATEFILAKLIKPLGNCACRYQDVGETQNSKLGGTRMKKTCSFLP